MPYSLIRRYEKTKANNTFLALYGRLGRQRPTTFNEPVDKSLHYFKQFLLLTRRRGDRTLADQKQKLSENKNCKNLQTYSLNVCHDIYSHSRP